MNDNDINDPSFEWPAPMAIRCDGCMCALPAIGTITLTHNDETERFCSYYCLTAAVARKAVMEEIILGNAPEECFKAVLQVAEIGAGAALDLATKDGPRFQVNDDGTIQLGE